LKFLLPEDKIIMEFMCYLIFLEVSDVVQEKKVKKLSEMNLDRSAAPANGSPGGVGYLSPSLSNGNALKPGRLPLLRLPV
ncbi:hypothetical protein ACJX0J_025731, partial [Zea mays]